MPFWRGLRSVGLGLRGWLWCWLLWFFVVVVMALSVVRGRGDVVVVVVVLVVVSGLSGGGSMVREVCRWVPIAVEACGSCRYRCRKILYLGGYR